MIVSFYRYFSNCLAFEVNAMSAYLAEYDYLAKSSDELSLRKGDILTNAVRSEHGWLKGECRGKIGHFPENFVTALKKDRAKTLSFRTQSLDALTKRTSVNPVPTRDVLFTVKVLYHYSPVHKDELALKPNDIIHVTRSVEEGWYEGILNGQRGLFPSSFTTRIPDSKNSAVNGSDAPNYRSVQPKRTMMKARVLYNYRRAADDELSLAVDDIVTILEKNAEDEGWWKGELNGRVGVFPDNYVEEIFSTTNRSPSPDRGAKYPSHASFKAKSTEDLSHKYSDTFSIKRPSINDREGHSGINGTYGQRSGPVKPYENGFSHSSGSINERNPVQLSNHKNERRTHTPIPSSNHRDAGRIESPPYAARSFIVGSSSHLNLNDAGEFTYPSKTADPKGKTIEQLQRDLRRLETNMDDMRWKMNGQMSDLISELDQEKKSRATLQIELERLQKLIQKFSPSK